MKRYQENFQQVNASPDPQPPGLDSDAHTPDEGGILIYRELTSGEVFAVAGGPQIINDGLLPP